MFVAKLSNKHLWWTKKTWLVLLFAMLVSLAPVTSVKAVCDPNQQACSTTYGVSETYFGNGGELSACSTSYCTKQAAGETGVGNTSSTSSQAQAGFNSDRSQYLEFNVSTASINFGILSTGSAKTGTASFYVKAYLSSGYQVVTVSDPPAYGGHFLAPMTSGGASSPGTEQFGINLAANTSPNIVGSAAPVQVPDNTFSFGAGASGYATANSFKYNKGDVIAQSTKATGETDYTISYIMNIASNTPAGTYTMNHVLVATATF